MRISEYDAGFQVENRHPGNNFPQPIAKRKELRPTSPGIGHNGAPVEPAGDDEAVKFLYVQLHIGDYITGTMGMTPELEGAYCRFLIRLYQRGKAFPDDDRVLCAAMGLTIRVWKRLKEVLVGLGKIIMKNGCLTNDRFEKERLKRAEMLRKQAEAAHQRHAKARAEKASLPKVSAKLRANLAETSGKLPPNSDEKSNEINENGVSGTSSPRILESNNLKEEDSELRSESPGSPSADPGLQSELGLEDEGRVIWNKCVPWLVEASGRSERSVKTLTGKWLKVLTHVELLKLIRSAYRVEDPVGYISKVVSDHEQAIHASVRREHGRLTVFNGFKAELTDLLKGRDLERVLGRIGGKIPQHVVGRDLETRVRAAAIELIDEDEAKDRRYARAVSANKKDGVRSL